MTLKVGYHNMIIDTETGEGVQATISVFEPGTENLVTIYSDKDGGSKSNPFDTDNKGRFGFFADQGEYDIRVSGAEIIDYTLSRVSIIGLSDEFMKGIFDSDYGVFVIKS